jgi:hypothetical protein
MHNREEGMAPWCGGCEWQCRIAINIWVYIIYTVISLVIDNPAQARKKHLIKLCLSEIIENKHLQSTQPS